MSNARIEEAIERHWNSLPVNIEQMIRDSGLSLDKKATLDKGIAGELRRLDNGGYRISVQKSDHYYRQRFTMAHELGHYYLHRDLVGDGTDDTVKFRNTSDGNFYNSNIQLTHEREANAFAAAVLMPEHLIHAEVRDLPRPLLDASIKDLATRVQVSPQAFRIRLSDLGLQ